MPTATIPESLRDFFAQHKKLALAFSGGADSAYLLYAARECGCDVLSIYISSAFQPAFERNDAKRLAESLNVAINIVEVDVLSNAAVIANPPNRCYFCKQAIFSAILSEARLKGYDTVIDGTNAPDDAGDRPGMRALQEMRVLSPLRLCGIDKANIRQYSQAAGLFTWNKPAYACLATRIPAGETITAEKLSRVEAAEQALFDLGYTDFRVRLFHDAARLQFPAAQLENAVQRRAEIRQTLSPYFDTILFDSQDRG